MSDDEADMNSLTDAQLDAELAHMPFPDTDRVFDDALLARYRRGDLDEANTARVEQVLLQSAQARAVLAASTAPVDDALLGRLEAIVVPPASDEGTIANRVGIVAVAIALAASIVAWVMRPVTPDFAPRMELATVSGQIKAVRSGEDPTAGPLRFVPDARVKMLLGPLDGNAGGIPQVSAYRIGADDRMVPVRVRVTRGKSGVRLEGRAGDIFGEDPGERRIYLVFSPPDDTQSLARHSVDDALSSLCGSCWMTVTAEIVP